MTDATAAKMKHANTGARNKTSVAVIVLSFSHGYILASPWPDLRALAGVKIAPGDRGKGANPCPDLLSDSYHWLALAPDFPWRIVIVRQGADGCAAYLVDELACFGLFIIRCFASLIIEARAAVQHPNAFLYLLGWKAEISIFIVPRCLPDCAGHIVGVVFVVAIADRTLVLGKQHLADLRSG